MDFVKTIKSCLRYQYNGSCAWEKYIGKGRNGHHEVKSVGYLTDIFTIYPLAVYFHYSILLPPAFPNHLQCTNPHIFFLVYVSVPLPKLKLQENNISVPLVHY